MSSVIDLSKTTDRKEVANVADTTALMQLIERAARDPSCDIERMERLLAMHERLITRQSKASYMAALSRLQPKLPMIEERGAILNKSDEVQSRYALWEDIVTVITPILASEGFSLSFRTGNANQHIQVTGVLAHAEGHSEETMLDLPADVSGNKNAVQAVASSVSYGKRYTAGALLNLRMGAIDDDGQSASDKRAPEESDQNGVPGGDKPWNWTQVAEYAKRYQDALDISDRAVTDIHRELGPNEKFYSAVWSKIPSAARKSIKEVLARNQT
jgi:ERF superfamily